MRARSGMCADLLEGTDLKNQEQESAVDKDKRRMKSPKHTMLCLLRSKNRPKFFIRFSSLEGERRTPTSTLTNIPIVLLT